MLGLLTSTNARSEAFRLLAWRSEHRETVSPVIFAPIITKHPSPELWQLPAGGTLQKSLAGFHPATGSSPLCSRAGSCGFQLGPSGSNHPPSSLPWVSVLQQEGAAPLPSPLGGQRRLCLGGQQAFPEGVHHRLGQAGSHRGGCSIGGSSWWSHLQPCHGHPAAGRHPGALAGKRKEEECTLNTALRGGPTFAGDQRMPPALSLLPQERFPKL